MEWNANKLWSVLYVSFFKTKRMMFRNVEAGLNMVNYWSFSFCYYCLRLDTNIYSWLPPFYFLHRLSFLNGFLLNDNHKFWCCTNVVWKRKFKWKTEINWLWLGKFVLNLGEKIIEFSLLMVAGSTEPSVHQKSFSTNFEIIITSLHPWFTKFCLKNKFL